MVAKKIYFMDCHLAGRRYHDADEVWNELKVGTTLRLVLDKENRHDANAVAVIYDQRTRRGMCWMNSSSDTFPVVKTRTLPICSKWAGATSSSVVSAS